MEERTVLWVSEHLHNHQCEVIVKGRRAVIECHRVFHSVSKDIGFKISLHQAHFRDVIFAEFFIVSIHRLADAISEGNEDVAGGTAHDLFFIDCARQNPEADTAGFKREDRTVRTQ